MTWPSTDMSLKSLSSLAQLWQGEQWANMYRHQSQNLKYWPVNSSCKQGVMLCGRVLQPVSHLCRLCKDTMGHSKLMKTQFMLYPKVYKLTFIQSLPDMDICTQGETFNSNCSFQINCKSRLGSVEYLNTIQCLDLDTPWSQLRPQRQLPKD